MKHARTVALCLLLAACASTTPLGKYQSFTESYTEALNTLSDMRDAGLLSEGQLDTAIDLTRGIDVAHAAWGEAVLNGDRGEASRYADVARAALTRLVLAIAEWED